LARFFATSRITEKKETSMSLDNILALVNDDQEATIAGTISPPANAFASLGLASQLLRGLDDAGYTEPTPVQSRAIPEILAGRDLMVSSRTGSGKTAAFMLPALQRLMRASTAPGVGPRMLVLAPTRELALQVTKACDTYGKYMRRFKAISILGGMPYPLQNRLLRAHVDVLVATPGRLLDHINAKRIDFSRLELLVLDEADRMLDMGFIEDIEAIVAATPASRQTLLFSATLDGTVGRLAQRMLRDPLRIDIASAKTRHENIEQRLHMADDRAHKNRLLDHLLRDEALNQALVFTATKREADSLADLLAEAGFSAAALHGDMRQGERTRTLNAMRRGAVKVLVATDVAARGLDVQGISHVINYDLPKQAEDYVHRIGRTGRAGRTGIAISLAHGTDSRQVKSIERYTSQPIPVHVIAGLEPRRTERSAPKRSFAPGARPGVKHAPAKAHEARRGRPQGGKSNGSRGYAK
jgi:superfamily II DNA/RNA helicase